MRRINVLPLALVVGAALAGCQQGQDANTSLQDATTGNGVEIEAGDLQVEAVTVVAGNAGSAAGAVSAVIVNTTATADHLDSVTVDGLKATLPPEGVDVPGMSSVSVGTNGDVTAEVAGLTQGPGEFAGVSFTFSRNGIATGQALIVPAVSFYRGSGPTGTTPEPLPTRTPVFGEHEADEASH